MGSPYKAGLLRLSRDVRFCFKLFYFMTKSVYPRIPHNIASHIDAVACCELALFAIEELVDIANTRKHCVEMFQYEI